MKYFYVIKEYLQVSWQCLAYIYKFDKKGTVGRLTILLVFPFIANILSIYALSTQIIFYYNSEQVALVRDYNESQKNAEMYNTNYYGSPEYSRAMQNHYAKTVKHHKPEL